MAPGPALSTARCPELAHSRSSGKDCWVDGSQSVSASSWGQVPAPALPLPSPMTLAGPRRVAQRHWGRAGRGLLRGRAGLAPAVGPPGPCSEEKRHAAQQNPRSPTPPSSPGWGWGTPIVSLSGGEQTKKRLPGAAGRLTGPSSVSRRRHPQAFLCPLPRGDAGFCRAHGCCKNSPGGQHCSSADPCSPR